MKKVKITQTNKAAFFKLAINLRLRRIGLVKFFNEPFEDVSEPIIGLAVSESWPSSFHGNATER